MAESRAPGPVIPIRVLREWIEFERLERGLVDAAFFEANEGLLDGLAALLDKHERGRGPTPEPESVHTVDPGLPLAMAAQMVERTQRLARCVDEDRLDG